MKPTTFKAFRALKELVRESELQLSPSTEKPFPETFPRTEGLSDQDLFQVAMRDVLPLGWSSRPLPPSVPIEIHNPHESEDEGLKLLMEFVAGKGDIDLIASGEYIEGAPHPGGHLLLEQLRTGHFAVRGPSGSARPCCQGSPGKSGEIHSSKPSAGPRLCSNYPRPWTSFIEWPCVAKGASSRMAQNSAHGSSHRSLHFGSSLRWRRRRLVHPPAKTVALSKRMPPCSADLPFRSAAFFVPTGYIRCVSHPQTKPQSYNSTLRYKYCFTIESRRSKDS